MEGSDSIDPGGDALAVAVGWIAHVLTGQLATALAVLAVAAFGYTLLTGEMRVHRAGAVLLGCFILFGSIPIAAALTELSSSPASDLAIAEAPMQAGPVVSEPLPGYDPHASASVPMTSSQINDPLFGD